MRGVHHPSVEQCYVPYYEENGSLTTLTLMERRIITNEPIKFEK